MDRRFDSNESVRSIFSDFELSEQYGYRFIDRVIKQQVFQCLNQSVCVHFHCDHGISRSSISSSRACISWIDIDRVDYRYLLTANKGGLVALYDLEETDQVKEEWKQSLWQNRATTIGGGSGLRPLPVEPLAVAFGDGPCTVSSVHWYPVDNGIFIASTYSGCLRLFDTDRFQHVQEFRYGDELSGTNSSAPSSSSSSSRLVVPIHQARFCDDGQLVGVALGDGALNVCDLRTGDNILSLRLPLFTTGGNTSSSRGNNNSKAACTSLDWSPSLGSPSSPSHTVLAGYADGSVRFWDLRWPSTPLLSLDWRQELVGSSSNSSNRNNYQNHARNSFYSASSHSETHQRRDSERPITTILGAGSYTGWDVDGLTVTVVQDTDQSVFAPVVNSGSDSQIFYGDADRACRAHESSVTSVRYLPGDGMTGTYQQQVVTTDGKGRVRMWSALTGQLSATRYSTTGNGACNSNSNSVSGGYSSATATSGGSNSNFRLEIAQLGHHREDDVMLLPSRRNETSKRFSDDLQQSITGSTAGVGATDIAMIPLHPSNGDSWSRGTGEPTAWLTGAAHRMIGGGGGGGGRGEGGVSSIVYRYTHQQVISGGDNGSLILWDDSQRIAERQERDEESEAIDRQRFDDALETHDWNRRRHLRGGFSSVARSGACSGGDGNSNSSNRGASCNVLTTSGAHYEIPPLGPSVRHSGIVQVEPVVSSLLNANATTTTAAASNHKKSRGAYDVLSNITNDPSSDPYRVYQSLLDVDNWSDSDSEKGEQTARGASINREAGGGHKEDNDNDDDNQLLQTALLRQPQENTDQMSDTAGVDVGSRGLLSFLSGSSCSAESSVKSTSTSSTSRPSHARKEKYQSLSFRNADTSHVFSTQLSGTSTSGVKGVLRSSSSVTAAAKKDKYQYEPNQRFLPPVIRQYLDEAASVRNRAAVGPPPPLLLPSSSSSSSLLLSSSSSSSVGSVPASLIGVRLDSGEAPGNLPLPSVSYRNRRRPHSPYDPGVFDEEHEENQQQGIEAAALLLRERANRLRQRVEKKEEADVANGGGTLPDPSQTWRNEEVIDRRSLDVPLKGRGQQPHHQQQQRPMSRDEIDHMVSVATRRGGGGGAKVTGYRRRGVASSSSSAWLAPSVNHRNAKG